MNTTESLIKRIDALIAKADSTDYPEEAEALFAKAQELMSRHAIDQALLDSTRDRSDRGEVEIETIVVEAPYASAKASLLGAVAAANTSRVVMSSGRGGNRTCQVVGHRSDLDAIVNLYGALVIYASRAMLAAEVPSWDTARRFRHSFLIAFAGRVGERLRAARRDAVDEARNTAAGSGVDIVLADRMGAVDVAFKEAFPYTRTSRASSSSRAGHMSGRNAANNADIGSRGLSNQRGLGAGV